MLAAALGGLGVVFWVAANWDTLGRFGRFALLQGFFVVMCLAARSDVLWAPWTLVAMSAVSLWVHAHTGHRWRVGPQDLQVHAIGWGLGLVLIPALGRSARPFTGAGPWAWRSALTLWVVMLGSSALLGLFDKPIAPQYLLGLALLAAAAVVLALPRFAQRWAPGSPPCRCSAWSGCCWAT